MSAAGVRISGYSEVTNEIRSHIESYTLDSGKSQLARVMLDPLKTNALLAGAVPPKHSIYSASPIEMLKAVKNDSELIGMREAHDLDGVALARFFTWLEKRVMEEGGATDEYEIGEILKEFRSTEVP